MNWSGEFRNLSGVLEPGTLTVNGVAYAVPTGQFNADVPLNVSVVVSYVPTDGTLATYNQTFYFTGDAPYFVGHLVELTDDTPHAWFYTLQDACSATIRVYHAASGRYSRIRWQFGDGFETSGVSAAHGYRAFGQYTITEIVDICATVASECGVYTLSDCVSDTITSEVTVQPFIPTVSLVLDCGVTDVVSGGCSCGCNEQSACACFPVNQTLTVRSTINFNNYSCTGGSITLISCTEPEGLELIGCDGNGLTLLSCFNNTIRV